MCNDEVDMVECIDDDWYRGGEAGAVKTPPPFPSKGGIYTVIGARKVQHNGVALLCYALWEMPIRQGLWEADKFRPVRRPRYHRLARTHASPSDRLWPNVSARWRAQSRRR